MKLYSEVLESYLIPAEEAKGDGKYIAGAAAIAGLWALPRIHDAINKRKEAKKAKLNSDLINKIKSEIQNNPEDKVVLDNEIKFAQNAIKELNDIISKVKSVYQKKYTKYTKFGNTSDTIVYNLQDFVTNILSNNVNERYITIAYVNSKNPDLSDTNGVTDLFDDISDYIDNTLTKYVEDLIKKTKYLKYYGTKANGDYYEDSYFLSIKLYNIRKNSPMINLVNSKK